MSELLVESKDVGTGRTVALSELSSVGVEVEEERPTQSAIPRSRPPRSSDKNAGATAGAAGGACLALAFIGAAVRVEVALGALVPRVVVVVVGAGPVAAAERDDRVDIGR